MKIAHNLGKSGRAASGVPDRSYEVPLWRLVETKGTQMNAFGVFWIMGARHFASGGSPDVSRLGQIQPRHA